MQLKQQTKYSGACQIQGNDRKGKTLQFIAEKLAHVEISIDGMPGAFGVLRDSGSQNYPLERSL
jgi:hypothetical protein